MATSSRVSADYPQGGRGVWGWAFYDWANSAFATTVMAGFFPLFFKQYWSAGTDLNESTFQLGVANAAASLLIVLLAPVLGAIADRGGARKGLLLSFAVLGIAASAGLYFVQKGAWEPAALLYMLGAVGFSGSVIFYDSLIVTVAGESRLDRVSTFGYALGYLGGGLLFALNVAMTLWPAAFGLSGAAEAVRLSFLSVAVWWALFSIPLIVLVREAVPPDRVRGVAAVRAGIRQLVETFHHVRRLRMVFLFLLAYWCYIDGVDTIIRMAVDYGMALGFDSKDLITALLLTQFVGFPAAILFGRVAGWLGPKRAIFLTIGVYVLVVIGASLMRSATDFYLLAAVVGLVQGGIQSLSRSLYARLIPKDKSAEFFGFFNMLGKFAAVLGPLLVGWVSVATGSARLSMLSLLLLFGVGAILLIFVNMETGRRDAEVL